MPKGKKTVIMRVSVAGPQDLSARREYELPEDLADEFLSIGYANEVKPETRRSKTKSDEPKVQE